MNQNHVDEFDHWDRKTQEFNEATDNHIKNSKLSQIEDMASKFKKNEINEAMDEYNELLGIAAGSPHSKQEPHYYGPRSNRISQEDKLDAQIKGNIKAIHEWDRRIENINSDERRAELASHIGGHNVESEVNEMMEFYEFKKHSTIQDLNELIARREYIAEKNGEEYSIEDSLMTENEENSFEYQEDD